MAKKDYEHILNTFPKSNSNYKHIRENWEFVDTIDFTPYLKDNIDVVDVMTAVENDNMNNNNLPECCQNYVFNWITIYEFASYLTNRYGDKYMSDEREETHYYLLKKFKTRKECEEYEAQTCKYYHSITETVATTDFERGYQMALMGCYDIEKTIERGYCYGQKNAPECFCNGCIEKCTEKNH